MNVIRSKSFTWNTILKHGHFLQYFLFSYVFFRSSVFVRKYLTPLLMRAPARGSQSWVDYFLDCGVQEWKPKRRIERKNFFWKIFSKWLTEALKKSFLQKSFFHELERVRFFFPKPSRPLSNKVMFFFSVWLKTACKRTFCEPLPFIQKKRCCRIFPAFQEGEGRAFFFEEIVFSELTRQKTFLRGREGVFFFEHTQKKKWLVCRFHDVRVIPRRDRSDAMGW